jgi:hypothetical protein
MRHPAFVQLCQAHFLVALYAVSSVGVAAAAQPAAASRTYPDWSGVWEPTVGLRFTRPGGKPNPPPLTPEYAAIYKVATDAAAAGRPVSDPTAACIWPGMPRVITNPYPHEILIQEGRVTIIHEYQSQVRRIWTDGRKHPEDLEPSFNGDSIGHWEGDTLIVETVGLRDDTRIEATGIPHSVRLKVHERIRLIGPDTLENEVTLIDPLALTEPWVTIVQYARHRDWQILEFVCAENNRNPVSASGKTLTLGPDGAPIDKEQ